MIKVRLSELLGSDRPGHLFAAILTGLAFAAIGHYFDSPKLMGVGGVVVLWEWLATPDVDIAWKRRPKSLHWAIVCALWWPYSKIVPHRSKYSHSLRCGLPLRFFYAALMVLVPCELLELPLFDWMILDVRMLLQEGQLIEAAAMLWQRWSIIAMGAVIADTVHLAKDGYGPVEWLLGRG